MFLGQHASGAEYHAARHRQRFGKKQPPRLVAVPAPALRGRVERSLSTPALRWWRSA